MIGKGHEFSFLQALRLIQGRLPGRVRIRPVLSLAFAGSDVIRIDQEPDGFLVSISFLGLYGPGAPLPTFYTEELIDERLAELSVGRDFLDIFNQRIAELCYQCLVKYRLASPEGCDAFRERLFCLMGYGGKAQRRNLGEPVLLLPFAGIMAMRSHGAEGLAALLKGVLGVPVSILQCVERQMVVPEEQQAVLGKGTLGTVFAGSSMADRNGTFLIQLGPLDGETFAEFLPEGSGRRRLDDLVGSFLRAPLLWDLQLLLAAEEVPAVRLGISKEGRLGYDSWIAPRRDVAATVMFRGAVPFAKAAAFAKAPADGASDSMKDCDG
ncbi:type VI secretion protein [Geomonas silvestris]|uniref:Type VI secretion protein n=1 Tax=Geomonas silvestris TaxID=2740184 RepID=A0A6V8MKI8_9BACT|nr:type VI secretion protein [Geomonas silvestris]